VFATVDVELLLASKLVLALALVLAPDMTADLAFGVVGMEVEGSTATEEGAEEVLGPATSVRDTSSSSSSSVITIGS
jgi:hypothetical protein